MNTIIHAQELSVRLPEIGSTLPEEIQWMPPGEHTITALDSAGKPATRKVRVTEDTALRLGEVLSSIRSKVAVGQEDLPYIDFNHRDAEAAGHVLDFRWAGDDPVTGGIRAKIRWTEPGKAALAGRAYRRFSPSFQLDADGEVVGAPVNMGGLVNRAAFKTIEPIWSRSGDTASGGQINQRKDPEMDPNKELADLKAANADLANQVTELQAKLASANQAEVVKAKETEITALKAQVETLNAKLAEQAKANAKAIVDAAIKAGKLAPQAAELHAKWVDAITMNPDLAETLNALSPNPALGSALTNHSGAAGEASADKNKAVELHGLDRTIAAFKAQQKA